MGEAFSKVESSLTGRRWVGLPNETLRQGLAISQALQIPEIASRTTSSARISHRDTSGTGYDEGTCCMAAMGDLA